MKQPGKNRKKKHGSQPVSLFPPVKNPVEFKEYQPPAQTSPYYRSLKFQAVEGLEMAWSYSSRCIEAGQKVTIVPPGLVPLTAVLLKVSFGDKKMSYPVLHDCLQKVSKYAPHEKREGSDEEECTVNRDILVVAELLFKNNHKLVEKFQMYGFDVVDFTNIVINWIQSVYTCGFPEYFTLRVIDFVLEGPECVFALVAYVVVNLIQDELLECAPKLVGSKVNLWEKYFQQFLTPYLDVLKSGKNMFEALRDTKTWVDTISVKGALIFDHSPGNADEVNLRKKTDFASRLIAHFLDKESSIIEDEGVLFQDANINSSYHFFCYFLSDTGSPHEEKKQPVIELPVDVFGDGLETVRVVRPSPTPTNVAPAPKTEPKEPVPRKTESNIGEQKPKPKKKPSADNWFSRFFSGSKKRVG